MSSQINGRLESAATDLLRGLRFELVDLKVTRESGRLFLRVYIDKEGGVTVDDCAEASELIGELVERENAVRGPYTLEVMSPGLRRHLNDPRDFTKNIKKRVTIRLREPMEEQSRVTGIIEEAGIDECVIDTGSARLVLDYDRITTARLDPELPW